MAQDEEWCRGVTITLAREHEVRALETLFNVRRNATRGSTLRYIVAPIMSEKWEQFPYIVDAFDSIPRFAGSPVQGGRSGEDGDILWEGLR